MRPPCSVFWALVASGCTGLPAIDDAAGPWGSPPACSEDCEPTAVSAPDLAPGTYWRFRGRGAYDVEEDFRVVVARAQGNGYLFAAGNESEVDGAVTWGRVWFGERDRDLNPPYQYGGDEAERYHLFDFPLVNGKSWVVWPEGPRVTATTANVTALGASWPGFEIRGQLDDLRLAWDYVPELGFFTKYVVERDRRTYDLKLVDHGSGSPWVWFEEGPSASASWADPASSSPLATLTVPPGMDSVVGIAYGQPGSRGIVAAPGTASTPWLFEGRGCCRSQDDWVEVRFAATPGDWRLAMSSTAPDSFGAIDLMAVTWVRP